MFNGTVFDNLCYALKHHPIPGEAGDHDKEVERALALRAGNSPNRYDDDWIDLQALGLENREQLTAHIIDVLKAVEMDEEIYQFGLLSLVDQSENTDLIAGVMQARRQLRDKFKEPEIARLVEPFDHEKYNLNMTVSENLLFGTVYDDAIDLEQLIDYPAMQKVLKENDLAEEFLNAGVKIAEIMLDLFSDVEPDSELFEQFSFIEADDLPEFNKLLQESRQHGVKSLPQNDRRRLISLPFKLIVARHRLGLMTESIQQRILAARKQIHEHATTEDLGIEFFEESSFNPRISIQDNILFGKLAYGQAHAQQKINWLARALLKAPDLLIINEALSSLDTASERRLIGNVRQKMENRGILWMLGRVQLAEQFDAVMVMERGKLVDKGPFAEIQSSSEHFQHLLTS
jgi:hypothetical protein